MTKRKSYHVVREEGKWAVKSSSSKKTSGKFKTQKKAIESARDIAKSKGGDLYIHGKNGMIRDRRSYGRNPFLSKDRRPIGEAKGKVKIAGDFDEEFVSSD